MVMYDTEMSLIKHLTRIADSLEKLVEQNEKVLNNTETNELNKQLTESKEKCFRRGKLIQELRSRVQEANGIISLYRIYDDTECGKATDYCKKWNIE